jgi:hypothetical protein
MGPRFKPANTYRAVQKLPPDFRRVAILPLTTHVDDLADSAHLDQVQRILEEELRKTRKFETLSISRIELSRWIGRRQVSASEPLPADFLARIRTNLVADGVVFVRIHSLRVYPPLSIGLDARLVTTSTGQTLWSSDETFDAGDAEVARSARDYFRAHHTGPAELGDPQADLRSPSHFSRYAAQAAFDTLPAR